MTPTNDNRTVTRTIDKPNEREIVMRAEHVRELHSKEEVAALERDSVAYYETLNDEQRRATTLLVVDALIELIKDPDLWVPVSIVPVSDDRIDLWISLHMADIEQQVCRDRIAGDLEREAKREELQGIRAELTDNPEEVE